MAPRAALSQDETFLNATLDPSLHRDAHGTGAGVNRTESAGTENGQSTGYTFSNIGVASNIWNNEHNQVLFGVQYGSRTFDNRLTLPGGLVLPDRVDRASASMVYKHITGGDWSLTQGVQFSRTGIGRLSGPGTDGISLVGLAAKSPEPGYAWLYGYVWNHAGNETFTGPIPLIVYVNGARADFSYYVGFPLFGLDYSPHPDWWLSLGWALGGKPSATVSYKLSRRNFARLSYGEENWGYRLPLPFERNVNYSSERISLGWSWLPFFERRKAVSLNLSVARDWNRKIGSNDKLRMDDATSIGLAIGFGF